MSHHNRVPIIARKRWPMTISPRDIVLRFDTAYERPGDSGPLIIHSDIEFMQQVETGELMEVSWPPPVENPQYVAPQVTPINAGEAFRLLAGEIERIGGGH